ncbi:MAG: YicC family protein [Candidatus Coatesbacteria bacterium]|nr:YicC family protein [Candidatus Coatesbacteria bacterium]
MTGQAVGRYQDGDNVLTLEAKSVNGKRFKLSLRLPQELADHESRLSALCREKINRGSLRLEVLELNGFQSDQAAPGFDAERARAYLELLDELPPGVARSIDAYELLRLPGVLRDEAPRPDRAALEEALHEAAAQALDGLVENRRAEGRRLGEALRAVLAEFRDLYTRLREAAAEMPGHIQARLRERLAELTADSEVPLDEGRLEQEIAHLAQRADVTEELDRLECHLQAFDDALDAGGEVGRRLDFLCQEINRELNTTGSKAVGTAVSPLVIELKLLQDRLREQAANLA